MPTETMGPGLLSVKPLLKIDKKTSLDKLKGDYQKFYEKQLEGYPQYMEVWLEPATLLKDGTVFRKNAAWAFPGSAVAGESHTGFLLQPYSCQTQFPDVSRSAFSSCFFLLCSLWSSVSRQAESPQWGAL
jgi:hypothetical protein